MARYLFSCELLSDIVVSSNTATQGFHPSLDYIPGAKFLGLVAGNGLYDMESPEKILDLFHNGKVCYGDAFPYINGEMYSQVPFSWYHPKNEEIQRQAFLFHRMGEPYGGEKSFWDYLSKDHIQAKQARNGYISPSGKYKIDVNQAFSIKSAYDADRRTSRDAQMYGYFALKAGNTWAFIVEDKQGIYFDEIRKALTEGTKRIGRSRTAEYGLVKIDFVKKLKKEEASLKQGINYVYAQSNLCFYNEFDRSHGQPTAQELGFGEQAHIVWDLSQVRTRRYQSWNRKRFNRDSDRLIIVKGSVFAVHNPEESSQIALEPVGSHAAEGFGRIVYNPWFLQSDSPILSLAHEDDFSINYREPAFDGVPDTTEHDTLVMSILASRKSRRNRPDRINRLINQFQSEYGRGFVEV
jgi:hypothetical protein